MSSEYSDRQKEYAKEQRRKKKEESERHKKEEKQLKNAVKSTEYWAKRYQEEDGLTYEQAMLKAWNHSKVNRGNRYKF